MLRNEYWFRKVPKLDLYQAVSESVAFCTILNELLQKFNIHPSNNLKVLLYLSISVKLLTNVRFVTSGS